MTAFYLVSALVGGALVLMSLLGGAKELDGDADVEAGDAEPHVDAGVGDYDKDFAKDLEVDHGGPLWLPFLSLRFWTFFLAFAGVCGLLVGWTTDVGELLRGVVAMGTGLVAGTSVAYMMRYFKRLQVNAGADTKRLVGLEAKVLLPLSAESEGKIRVSAGGKLIDLIASCDDAGTIPIGSDVLIISVDGGTAKVVSSDAVLRGGPERKQLT